MPTFVVKEIGVLTSNIFGDEKEFIFLVMSFFGRDNFYALRKGKRDC